MAGDSKEVLEPRVAVLESEIKHLATKADIANLKVWILIQSFGVLLLLFRSFVPS